jgi:hypothetical protein
MRKDELEQATECTPAATTSCCWHDKHLESTSTASNFMHESMVPAAVCCYKQRARAFCIAVLLLLHGFLFR